MKMKTYFTTSTVTKWIPVFYRKDFMKILLDSLSFMIEAKRISLHGYVIMPNHLHLIFSVIAPYELGQIFRDFHKFTAQQILKILRTEKNLLLRKFIIDTDDRKYTIWQKSHMPKEVETEAFFLQKLEYIHNNPLQEKWHLTNKPENYLYSSAKDYILNEPGVLHIEKVI